MTIVFCNYRPKRARKARPVVEFPLGRIVSASAPKKRHYGEIRQGVPDEAERARLIAAFMERAGR